MQPLCAGKLNRRVQLQRPVTTPDALGESDTAFTTYYTCWASIDAQNSSLLYETSEFVSRPTMRITIRWTASVTVEPGDRVVYTQATTGAHLYTIQSFINTEQANRDLVILAYEVDPKE